MSFEGNSTSGEGFCAIFTAAEATPTVKIFGRNAVEECNVTVKEKMFVDNSILGVGYLIANTFIYILQTRMVLRHIVALLLTFSGICAFLLPSLTSEIAVLVAFTIFLMCSGVCVTTINIVTVGLFPTHLRGMTLSMTIVLGRLAIVIGVNVMGFLLESWCEETIYAVGALVALAALATMFVMPKKAINS